MFTLLTYLFTVRDRLIYKLKNSLFDFFFSFQSSLVLFKNKKKFEIWSLICYFITSINNAWKCIFCNTIKTYKTYKRRLYNKQIHNECSFFFSVKWDMRRYGRQMDIEITLCDYWLYIRLYLSRSEGNERAIRNLKDSMIREKKSSIFFFYLKIILWS